MYSHIFKVDTQHDSVEWEDDGSHPEKNILGGCIDRLPWSQSATDASLFFLTNEASTAFRLHVL